MLNVQHQKQEKVERINIGWTTGTLTIYPLHGELQSTIAIHGAHSTRIRQFDDNYQTFYYVDPTTNPPRTTWTRPGYNDGQAAPDQVDAMQGHAASYFASSNDYSHESAQNAEEAKRAMAEEQQGGAGGSGERGFVSSMAKHAIMSKMGMRPTVRLAMHATRTTTLADEFRAQ